MRARSSDVMGTHSRLARLVVNGYLCDMTTRRDPATKLDKQVFTRLTVKEEAALIRLAKGRGLTVSGIIRDLVRIELTDSRRDARVAT